MSERHSRLARRSFLAKAGAGAAAISVTLGATAADGDAQSASPENERWQPARHAEDDWLDRIPGKHRAFFDSTTIQGLGQAMLFANNYYTGNRNGYGLGPTDLAVVICMRHESTAFAYTDAIWKKYTKGLAERLGFNDPKTGQPPVVNVYRASDYGASLSNSSVTLDSLIKNGAHFAVCQLATRRIAGIIARQTGAKVDEIYQELTSNLIPNAHMVPAGIVAVHRAQERGYSFVYAV
jgi:intracellular sulfur oxidation DsrE/DsrF family protein